MTGRKNQFMSGGKPRPQYRVRLTCGCHVKTFDVPRSSMKFACPGAGHGYQLGWTQAVGDDGYTRDNIKGETR